MLTCRAGAHCGRDCVHDRVPTTARAAISKVADLNARRRAIQRALTSCHLAPFFAHAFDSRFFVLQPLHFFQPSRCALGNCCRVHSPSFSLWSVSSQCSCTVSFRMCCISVSERHMRVCMKIKHGPTLSITPMISRIRDIIHMNPVVTSCFVTYA